MTIQNNDRNNDHEDDDYPIGRGFSPEVTDVRLTREGEDAGIHFTYRDPRAEVIQAIDKMSDPIRRDLLQRTASLAIDMILGGRDAAILSSLDEKIGLQGELFDSKGREIVSHFESWAKGFIDNDLRASSEKSGKELHDLFEGYIGEKSGFKSLLNDLPRGVSDAIKEAFDPSMPNSSAARLINEFGESLNASTELAEDLSKLFNPNDEASVISSIRRDLNPNVEGSPMAAIIAKINQNEEKTREQINSLSESILLLNERLEARARKPDDISSGIDFEQDVLDALAIIAKERPLELERTGSKVGKVPNSKAGDGVLSYSIGHKSEGRRIAVEVKHDKSFSTGKILAECQRVRENRTAEVCLFIIAREKAPEGMPRLSVEGQDVVVVVDGMDEIQQMLLEGAVSVSETLMSKVKGGEDRDMESIATLVGRLNNEIKRYETIGKHASTAISANEKIRDNSRKGIKKIGVAMRDLRSILESN